MSHFGDFMDGVPVKISERYIRPSRIELPYSVNECGARAQNTLDNAKYCFTFETNVLGKVKELRSAKETKKNERRHRLQLLEEAKQKKLDAIAAAEAEEKMRQLSVSEISYPSTDEISEISPDEKTEKTCEKTLTQEDYQHQTEPYHQDLQYQTCVQPQESQLNILQPIPVRSNYQQSSLLDDPDPLQELKTRAIHIPQYKNLNPNIDTLTYKDFEHDTSSPFDNVELKTINEMELLAQVLESQKGSGTICPPQQYVQEPYTPQMPNCGSQAQMGGVSYTPNAYMDQTVQDPGLMYTSLQHYPVTNGYYIPQENCDNPNMMYMPNYQYYVPANPYEMNTYNNQVVATDSGEMNHISNSQQLNNPSYLPQPYYYDYTPMPYQYQQSFPTPAVDVSAQAKEPDQSSSSQHTIKSRSRSVPDIVKELDEEIASAKLRANERSYNASPAPKDVPKPALKKDTKRSKRRLENLPNPYDKLSSRLQSMCQKIHSMGFPLDRVARVCTLVGDSDKKVIEGLLIMGELMDLGFTEDRVSAALAKHDFNRDKALDELVS